MPLAAFQGLRSLVCAFCTSLIESLIYILSGLEQMLAELLLVTGRPTPSQCAVFELTHRLDSSREKELSIQKELETVREQLSKSMSYAQSLEQRLQQVASHNEQLHCEASRAWGHHAGSAHLAAFLLGAAAAWEGQPLLNKVNDPNIWPILGVCAVLAGLPVCMFHPSSRWFSISSYLALPITVVAGCAALDFMRTKLFGAAEA